MRTLAVDIETFSRVDLMASGVYRYVDDAEFRILLFAYAFDNEPVRVVDLTCDVLPDELYAALEDPNIIKTAYNANFEITCINRHFALTCYTEVDQWRCTSVQALELGLPNGLDKVAKALNLEQQKDAAGKALIRYFSCPCLPTAVNGGRERNLPTHDEIKWEHFKSYCKKDVEVERAVRKAIEKFPISDSEQKLWELDQKMNNRGVAVDMQLVSAAIRCSKLHSEKLLTEALELTGLDNPNSVAQIKNWLLEVEGLEVESLNKKNVPEIMDACESDVTKRVLELRQEMAKTSVSKYGAIDRSVCDDGRVRGLLQFYGANRTGRWCLTGDHEVLTSDGWERLDFWGGGAIACWTPKGEIVSFQKAEKVSFDYCGPTYTYSDKRIDQCSTPDHKMYIKQKYGGDWGASTVKNMAEICRPSIPFTGFRTTSSGMEHAQLRVMIMVQAEGHYTTGGSIRLKFSKKRKIERCKELLRRAEITFVSRLELKGAVETIHVYSRQVPLWLRVFRNKTFGTWLFDESADVFFDELVYWDGYRSAPNSIQYSTCNKQNADIIQGFAHMSGRTALIRVKDRSAQHPNWSDSYVVDVWLSPKNCHEIKTKPVVEQFSGKVYCAVTPTGYFLVRRNGRVWVTGNSGRLVQVQNLPKNYLDNLDVAREFVRCGDFDSVELLFDKIPNVLSQLIRTAFVPDRGEFVVADFSAIEARVTAWLSGEKWRLDVFAGHGKIYEASASAMFNIPMVDIGKGSALRQKGKVAELALGYGGSIGALIAMGALDMGIPELELPTIVSAWRRASPRIVAFWRKVEAAALMAVKEKTSVVVPVEALDGYNGITFSYKSGILFVKLPSGRSLAYVRPQIETGKFGNDCVSYEGYEAGRWSRVQTFGGKLCENIVQAVSRDCLAVALGRVDAAGYDIAFHVHDEIVCVGGDLERMIKLMTEPIAWASGLLLKADGFTTRYYMKEA